MTILSSEPQAEGANAAVWCALAAFLIGCAACGDRSAASEKAADPSDTLRAAVVTERVLEDSDDPAIWIAPDPDNSVILGTDKNETNGGVHVFELNGRIDRSRSVTGLQRMNNVDVVQSFRVGGRTIDIAIATERRRMMLRVFELPSMRPIDNGGIPVFAGDTARWGLPFRKARSS